MKFAFSTVACPTWTLERVARLARDTGFGGVELRTLGHADPTLACDPCHTAGEKVRELFEEEGVEVVGVSTSIRYDQKVFPPIIGRAFQDLDKPVRETKSMVRVARGAGASYVRVFGFEYGPNETRARGSRRVIEKATAAAKSARHSGVKVAIENAGSWARGADLAELVEACAMPEQLGATYAIAPAVDAGEDPVAGIAALGSMLKSVRVTDTVAGRPVALGQGDQPIEQTIGHLARTGYDGWVVFDWPRLWMPHLPGPEAVLVDAAEKLYRWASAGTPGRIRPRAMAGV
ncbi:MAG: TIM barrel protein [Phycisphaerales bacterium]